VDLYIHSPIRLHGVVLNFLSTKTTLPLPLFYFIKEVCGGVKSIGLAQNGKQCLVLMIRIVKFIR
jgi:hypothetical protein